MRYSAKHAMVKAMQKYGGGFVEALANCFALADSKNLDRLYGAFPEYVKQYSEMADKDTFQPYEFCDCTIIENPVHNICGNCNKPFRQANNT